MMASVFGYGLPMIISIFTTPVVLNELGITAYGLINIVAVITGYLSVMDAGLDLPITKYLAEDQAKSDKSAANLMLNNTLQLYLILGFVGMIIIITCSRLFVNFVFEVPKELSEDAVIVFQLSGIGFFGSVMASWGRAIFMGIQRFDITYGISISVNILGISLGLLTIYLGYGVVGFVLMRVLASILSPIGYWIFINNSLPFYRLRFGFSTSTLLRIRSYIGYGALNRIVGVVIGGLDKALIGVWLGVAAAGIYSLPFMLMSSLGYMLSYMLGFTLPMSSELYAKKEFEKLKSIFLRSTKFLTAVSSMVFVPALVFSDLFISLWINPEMGIQTRYIGILLLLSGYISTLTVSIPNNLTVGIGKIKEFTIYSAVRSMILGIGCVIFIRTVGIEGAGIALLLANIIDLMFLCIFLKYFLQVKFREILRKAYLPALTIGVILGLTLLIFRQVSSPSWLGLALAVGLYQIVYVAIGFRFKVFGETEAIILSSNLQFLKRRLKRR